MASGEFHPVSVPRPSSALLWSEKSLNLEALLKESTLPVVVKMNAADDSSKLKKDAGTLLQQPLLLFKESKGFKVIAKNVSSLVAVRTSRDGVQYREGGATIVIPVQYPGWFRVLEEDTVPILSVSNLARVMPTSFLSAKRVPGFSLLDPLIRKDIMYERLEFPPGVFTLHSVFEDHVKYTTTKNTVKRKLLRCLVCVTGEGLDLLIPFDVTGEFYVVEHRNPNAKTAKADKNACAYTLKQLIAMGVFTRPLVLKLLIGDPPSKPCGFTGVMKVVDIVKDWTVIAQTLDGNRKLLELPVLPFPEFAQSTNGKDLLESGSLRAELNHLRSGIADQYAKEIKVKTSLSLKPTKPQAGETRLPVLNGASAAQDKPFKQKTKTKK
ncbi:uncharacterized protein LOC127862674 isoform X2 [Dreissena polymorpha]|uniref:CABIT domain-containing protein n=1 Tax=Dreissena polymorpha TaxID=45954 RepID=A0A9D4BH44_DREPO|nr:uncharacterized protein LOC127862674 isoform X2 [Dreissena polymorpha]KAH3694807.1 hypothetical protein DPMN_082248 [Dreissena polymorpha]